MTWPLTPEEIAFPTLMPPVGSEYPAVSAEVPTTVGWTTANPFTQHDGMYAGPVNPKQIPTKGAFGPLANDAWGMRTTEDFEAGPPSSFYPPTAASYEDAMFFTTERVQPFLEPLPNGSGMDGLGEDPGWYETPGGALVLGLGAGVVSYLATRAFLRSRARARR